MSISRRSRRAQAASSAAIVCTLAVILVLTPTADAVIGRANIDGTGLDRGFIDTPANTTTWDVAADSGHVYWTWSDRATTGGWIGRATLDGSDVESRFIPTDGHGGLAVGGAHLYWANPQTHTIGRANLDGSGVDQSLVSSIGKRAFDVEADESHVYWAWDQDTIPPGGPRFGWVGRANLDGIGANPNLIGPLSFGSNHALALDAGHVYFTAGSEIYRADLDGTGAPSCPSPVDECVPAFVPNAPAYDLAVDGTHIYGSAFWGGGGHSAPEEGIGRATLDGSDAFAPFIITDYSLPVGMAIDSSHLYWAAQTASPKPVPPETTITKSPRKETRKRRATFRFTSSEADATFQCRLDRRPARRCESPTTFRHLRAGKHTFKVRAIGKAGDSDRSPAVYTFKVVRQRSGG